MTLYFNKSIFKRIAVALFLFFAVVPYLYAGDSASIKVHFIYGSKPKWKFRSTERLWLGGTWGGHVGIEYAPSQVIDFVPQGRFHVISHGKARHSRFNLRSTDAFWTTFGSSSSLDVKRVSFTVPISESQKVRLDSVVKVYSSQVPYDYAFIGMRCAAAAYDVLSQIGIFEPRTRRGMVFGIFYPRILRRKMFVLAQRRGWEVRFQEGSPKRIWGKDTMSSMSNNAL